MQLAVIIPTLNEADNIGLLLDQVMAADSRLHAVVIDDGSVDGTLAAIEGAQAKHSQGNEPRIHLIARGKKLGYASAVQDGIRYALQNGAERVIQMDADFSHDPAHLPEIIAKGERYDLVIGSRYVAGGGTRNWGLDRVLLSGTANLLVRSLLRVPARDCTSGYRSWNRELIDRAQLLTLQAHGYAFLFAGLSRSHRLGASVHEIPIIFVDRQHGKSKMSKKIILEAMVILFKMWLGLVK